MRTVRVELGKRAYDVIVGSGLLKEAGTRVLPLLKRPRLAVITDETVAQHHLATIEEAFSSTGIENSSLSLRAGEATKTWEGVSQAVDWLLDKRVERQDLIVALGGGVIGDVAGFAAAILRRGVRYVQVPTTLLAQVDSSVGGKTGINTHRGKNLVGAYHQPSLVLADIEALGTLPERDFLAGYGEVAKYGLLGDADFFEALERESVGLARRDADLLEWAVGESVSAKARIVERDETEEGERALLNLGHTFAHALETATGYSQRLLHGEAVAIGCVLAFDASARLGLCAQEAPVRVRSHFRDMGCSASLSDVEGELPDADGLLDLMAQDKKAVAGRLRYVLVRGIGDAFVANDVNPQVIKEALEAALAER
jgi:3-dehydroquinate synthase